MRRSVSPASGSCGRAARSGPGRSGPAAPAFAGSGDGVPSAGDFVLWRDANWTGPLYDLDNHTQSYSGLNFVGTSVPIDNNASSAANYYSITGVRAFSLGNWGGGHIQLTAYRRDGTGWYINQAQLAATFAAEPNRHGQNNYDDNFSSHRFL